MTWKIAVAQDIGAREQQEDYCEFHIRNDVCLCILADGMGGHASGEIAASLAVKSFVAALDDVAEHLADGFINALDAANSAIAQHVRNRPHDDGMGCTLVGVELEGAHVRWISVGDSRLLHFSSRGLEQLNADHSMAASLEAAARNGIMSVDEARSSSSRHVLLSAVTGERIAKVDFNRRGRPVDPGDVIVLSSDGLDTLDADSITAAIMKAPRSDSEAICSNLMHEVASRQRTRQDNTTVLVACLVSQDPILDHDCVTTRPTRTA
ncbi:protein phosphatase 2C domain-containing protein [Rhizobium sp. CSW-27]|uniref:PP2C family protein-serine/threonine phosphatase n=1 Tax=Rhizobium sp. CSW-27 TaxID=2839985 RepID=UPI001C039458|nr:protein phosphatase 2C domain-containing protein [Rhizobium sp. CSW-27]MBT9373316.1 protein phosphatase 2C domain-containing protein [Rhizobium sp. CSW-27]